MNQGKFLLATLAASALRLARRRDESRRGTRVLMYHDINEHDMVSDIYSIPLLSFTRGLAALSEWATSIGHTFVSFTATPQPGLAVTFDDGYKSTLRLAAPIFAEHEIPFHVFVTKSYTEQNNDRYLSRVDIRTLSQMPLATLGVHGVSHRHFSQLEESSLRQELNDSRGWLEQIIGKPVTSLSYPHGDFTPRVSDVVAECGFTAAACSNAGTFTDVSQSLQIPRVDIWSHDSPKSTVAKARGDWDLLLP